MWLRTTIVFFSLCGLSLLGCKSENFAPSSARTTFGSGGNPGGGDPGGGDPGSQPDGGTIPGGGNPGGGDGGTIAHFKPALVIRATGCIMCHGRVESTIITDFGHGDPYFFGAGTPGGFSPFSGSIFGDHAENWRTARVWGQVITPRANVSYAGVTESLAQYLRNRLLSPDGGVTAAPAVVEKDVVYIGAPTRARLLQVAGDFSPNHPEWKFVSIPTAPPFSGIETAPGGHFVRNTPGQELVCHGDLFVNSVLFLNQLRLRTDNGGCRIYTTNSVFIQGPIVYLGTAEKRNLQITSSRAVVLGMGPGALDGGPNNTLRNRLQDFWTRFTYFTRDSSLTMQQKLDEIVNDSLWIPELRDASAQAPHYRSLGFERLLLNAPNYQSRYQGQFKGVIIAEMAIGSLGNFSFLFDNVFETVPILPRINEAEMIRVE